MVQGLPPCITGWSPAEIITAIGVSFTSLTTGFLAYRRIRKDDLDQQRWSICPLVSEGHAVRGHQHRGRSKPDGD